MCRVYEPQNGAADSELNFIAVKQRNRIGDALIVDQRAVEAL